MKKPSVNKDKSDGALSEEDTDAEEILMDVNEEEDDDFNEEGDDDFNEDFSEEDDNDKDSDASEEEDDDIKIITKTKGNSGGPLSEEDMDSEDTEEENVKISKFKDNSDGLPEANMVPKNSEEEGIKVIIKTEDNSAAPSSEMDTDSEDSEESDNAKNVTKTKDKSGGTLLKMKRGPADSLACLVVADNDSKFKTIYRNEGNPPGQTGYMNFTYEISVSNDDEDDDANFFPDYKSVDHLYYQWRVTMKYAKNNSSSDECKDDINTMARVDSSGFFEMDEDPDNQTRLYYTDQSHGNKTNTSPRSPSDFPPSIEEDSDTKVALPSYYFRIDDNGGSIVTVTNIGTKDKPVLHYQSCVKQSCFACDTLRKKWGTKEAVQKKIRNQQQGNHGQKNTMGSPELRANGQVRGTKRHHSEDGAQQQEEAVAAKRPRLDPEYEECEITEHDSAVWISLPSPYVDEEDRDNTKVYWTNPKY